MKATNKVGLRECGRLQYFYHSPSSQLPIRDVLNEQRQGNKTEPHIEVGAENYWVGCYQSNNIIPFTKNNEKYLFLMTTCCNQELRNFCGKKIIVGYISKKTAGNRNGHHYVKGDIFLFSFEDAIPIEELNYSKWTRMKKVDENITKKLLTRFQNRKNIIAECIQEIKRLDTDNLTCLRISESRRCEFHSECKRWHQL